MAKPCLRRYAELPALSQLLTNTGAATKVHDTFRAGLPVALVA